MSALAGYWRFDRQPDAKSACLRMLEAQRIHGHEEPAIWSNGDIAFGCRLTAMLPEDAFDHQPLVSTSGKHVLVADVRLDNRDELTTFLRISPSDAAVRSDADILLACLEKWDEDCLERIVGDYALAFWNGAERRLRLARDPLGQRPLHYHKSDRLFAFSSMPKGLHGLAEIPFALDEEKIAEFILLLPEHGTRTFFEGIERVEPGHVVTVEGARVTSRRYWNPRRRVVRLKGSGEYAEALRAHLDQAVGARLRGTGDVGVFMSGGLDSTAVAATAARLLANSQRRVVAFTAVPRQGFEGTAPRNRFVDEGPHAAAVAALYPNIEHIVVPSDSRSLLDSFDSAFREREQPLLNVSNTASPIFDLMRDRKLPIALDGTMGNIGLSYDGIELLPELFRDGRWFRWFRETQKLVTRGGARWRGALALTFGPWCPEWLWIRLSRYANGYAPELLAYTAINPARLSELDVGRRAKARGLNLAFRPGKDAFAERLRILKQCDDGNTNKGFLAGYGFDMRDPTADIRLLEFCLSVPTEEFLKDGVRRALARIALADRLPKVVVEETRTGYQAADWYERAYAERDRMAAEIERLDHCVPAARALDLVRLQQLVENWPAGGWELDEVIEPYHLALLRGLAVGHFLRRASGSNA